MMSVALFHCYAVRHQAECRCTECRGTLVLACFAKTLHQRMFQHDQYDSNWILSFTEWLGKQIRPCGHQDNTYNDITHNDITYNAITYNDITYNAITYKDFTYNDLTYND